MKKMIERIGAETVFAGVFGCIAIVAVFAEMAIAGFDAASIAGGVKDIAGTIIAVVMLLIAIRALAPRKKLPTDSKKHLSRKWIKLFVNIIRCFEKMTPQKEDII